MTTGRIVNHAGKRSARFSIFSGEFYHAGADYASVVYAYERRAAEFLSLTLILRGIVRHPCFPFGGKRRSAPPAFLYRLCRLLRDRRGNGFLQYRAASRRRRDASPRTCSKAGTFYSRTATCLRRTSSRQCTDCALRFAAFAVPAGQHGGVSRKPIALSVTALGDVYVLPPLCTGLVWQCIFIPSPQASRPFLPVAKYIPLRVSAHLLRRRMALCARRGRLQKKSSSSAA